LLLPLGGASAGGAAGYLTTKKEKNKARNAAYGALMGGLSGAGAQLVRNWLAHNPGAAGGAGGGDKPATLPPAGTAAADAAGAIGGGVAGWRGGGALGDYIKSKLPKNWVDPPRDGELTRLADAKPKSTIVQRAMGKAPKNSFGDFFKSLLEKHDTGPAGRGEPLSASLNPVADAVASAAREKSLADLLRTASLGNDPATRQERVKLLTEAARLAGETGRGPIPADLLTQLEKMRFTPGQRALRTAGKFAPRVGGGILGGLGGEYLADRLYRMGVNALSGAPETPPQ